MDTDRCRVCRGWHLVLLVVRNRRTDIPSLCQTLLDLLLLLQSPDKGRLQSVGVFGLEGLFDIVRNALVTHHGWLLYYSTRNPLAIGQEPGK